MGAKIIFIIKFLIPVRNFNTMVSFDNIEVLNFIVATISMIFFIMQAWKMYKKEPFGAIYTILYLFGALFTPVILFNGLVG